MKNRIFAGATHFLFISLLAVSPSLLADTTIKLDFADVKQEMDGFGASDAWTVNPLIKKWMDEGKESDIERLADLLFSEKVGIGLSAWRFNIGAGSYEQGDKGKVRDVKRRAELFSSSATAPVDSKKQVGQVRFLKEAHARGVENFVAFANSPPVWATKNGLANPGDGKEIGSTNLKSDQIDSFTAFLVKVITYLRKDVGVPINYISPVNEPTWEWQGQTQEGNRYNNDDLAQVYRSLYKALKKNKLEDAVGIDGVESVEYMAALSDENVIQLEGKQYQGGMNGKGHGKYKNYIQDFLGDKELRTILENRISLHGYFSDASAKRLGTLRDTVFNEVKQVSPTAKIWMSEYSILGGSGDARSFNGKGFDVNDIEYALHIAKVIQRDLTRLNASAWHWWLAITPYNFKDGLVKVDAALTADSLQESKVLWVLGNYSRFIRPKDQRVASGGADDLNGIMSSAYKSADSAKVVIVLVNNKKEAEKIHFTFSGLNGDFSQYDTYVTNADSNLQHGGSISLDKEYLLPARSVVTLVANKITNKKL